MELNQSIIDKITNGITATRSSAPSKFSKQQKEHARRASKAMAIKHKKALRVKPKRKKKPRKVRHRGWDQKIPTESLHIKTGPCCGKPEYKPGTLGAMVSAAGFTTAYLKP